MKGWSFLTGYPQLREAETEAPGRLPGTTVRRFATIAPSLVHIRDTAIGTAKKPATESGGIPA